MPRGFVVGMGQVLAGVINFYMNYLRFTKNIQSLLSGSKSVKALYFLLCIGLALSLAHESATLTWKIIDSTAHLGEDFDKQPQSAKGAGAIRALLTDKRVLPSTELPLFGEAPAAGKSPLPTKLSAKIVPVTTLGLLLKGVVAAEPMSRALAVVAEKGKKSKEELYGIGDKLPGNAVISEILPDRIIIRRGGVLETLMLQTGEKGARSRRGQNNRAGGSGKIVNLGDGVHWKIDNAYLNQRLGDLPGLAREVGVEVYKENNVQKGYRLVSARGSKLLREMGLKPGDVLLEVNGIKLSTIQAGLSVYQKMRSANEMRVVFSRNGRTESRIYEIGRGERK